MSIFKRPTSPFYYTEIQVNGRRVVRSTGTDSKREALAFERKLRTELEAESTKPRRKELTVDQACGAYWIDRGQHLSWSDHVRRHLVSITAFLGRELALSECGNEHVARVVEERKRAGAGAAGVNRTLAVFRQVLRHASRVKGYEVQAIHWSDHWQQEPKGRVRFLKKLEVERLLELSPEPLRLAIEWSIYSGCRKSETYRIRWPDVDFDRGCVAIRKAKTGSRVVWLTDASRELLLRCPRRNDTDLVFDGRNRRKLFEAAIAAAGIEDFKWHDLRHTHATWLRQGGAPLEVVQRSLGHASITTTQRYAHVDDREVVEAMSRLPVLNSDSSGNVVPLRRRKK